MTILCVHSKFSEPPENLVKYEHIRNFALGCNGKLVSHQDAKKAALDDTWAFRGTKYMKDVRECWETGREFYYIDNGYFGNPRGKFWHRIVKNHVHDVRPIIQRNRARLDVMGLNIKKHTPGRYVLLAPPSEKSFKLWNIDFDTWVKDTLDQIKQVTDRSVKLRIKKPRTERNTVDRIDHALDQDIHCVVTHSSVIAVESVILGKPAICLGPNAAGKVCSQSIINIENPYFPGEDEREMWLRHLSYSQFSLDEMRNGTAWKILNEHATYS